MEFNKLLRLRLAIAFVGAFVWFVSVRIDDARGRVVGMVLLGVALVLRFVPKRNQGSEDNVT